MKIIDIIGKAKRFVLRIERRIVHTWLTMLAPKHYYVSTEEYHLKHPSKVKKISITIDNLIFATSKGEGNNSMEIKRSNYIVCKATCFAYSDIIQLEDGCCIYSIKENNGWIGTVDFMDEILLKDTDSWCKLRKCHMTKHIDKAIKIGGMFGFNYYHFIFQILPKLFETSEIDSSIPLLLDRAATDVPSMRQLTEWCNMQQRGLICMDYDVAYQVDELYVISDSNICVPNWKKDADYERIPVALYSPTVIDIVSKYLLAHKDRSKFPKKIFISRKSTKRRAYNEPDLWQVAKQYGFIKVQPENLDISQQIAFIVQ